MISGPTQTVENIEKYMTLVRTMDPELYDIKLALIETRTNPHYFPAIIRAISMLAYGTAYGSIHIYMEKGNITQIKTEESTVIRETAVLIDDKK